MKQKETKIEQVRNKSILKAVRGELERTRPTVRKILTSTVPHNIKIELIERMDILNQIIDEAIRETKKYDLESNEIKRLFEHRLKIAKKGDSAAGERK